SLFLPFAFLNWENQAMLNTLTLEIRWFEREVPSVEIKQWFSVDCPGEPLDFPEEREDLYLYVPQGERFSLKLRQERLELKWRKTELGIAQFGTTSNSTASNSTESPVSWQGNLERWVKWTYEDATSPDIISLPTQEKSLWIGVKKMRWQRRYQDITCELSQLEVKNQHWWSLAFEMVEKPNQREHFEQIISQVNQTYRGPALLADKSYAYPSWLSLLRIV
ncbi:MAG: hypothetical protein ACRDEA_04720, partial [Microcystaceae cyanobacterium]